MIQKLDHKKTVISEQIRAVFQISYAVEAELLKAVNFPPLQRSLNDFMNSDTAFFGYWKDQELAAVIEVKREPSSTHIQSLVVAPRFFRLGIGSALIKFVLNSYQTKTFTVETGLANGPATDLYKKFKFQEAYQYDTDHGIRKIRFQKELGT
ncbi:MAG: GNAT family N-acetyltransferase [Eudoraea sp.]|nr:GNAT family N-acetyltransferase [Eudoraea sp.]